MPCPPVPQSSVRVVSSAHRPEEEGKWALPHGELGLDVIALVGTLRYTSHRSIPEIHQALRDRGVVIAERTVTHLLRAMRNWSLSTVN